MDVNEIHLLLRSAAHIVFSFVESLLLTLTLCSFRYGKQTFRISLVLSCLIAAAMELIKLPIPGRHFSVFETLLNMASGAAGVLLVLLLLKRRRR